MGLPCNFFQFFSLCFKETQLSAEKHGEMGEEDEVEGKEKEEEDDKEEAAKEDS